jgi:uncharacterized membrane protein
LTKVSVKDVDEYIVTFCLFLFAAIFMIFFVDFGAIPFDSLYYWGLVLLVALFDIPAFIFMMKAFKKGDISLIVPLVSLIPVLILLIEFLFFGVFPSLQGVLGVFVVAFGVYLLGFDWRKKGVFIPIRNIFSDVGARYFFVSILLWATVVNVHKVGVEMTSAIEWTFSSLVVCVLVLGFVLFFRRADFGKVGKSSWVFLVVIGFLHALENLAQNSALAEHFASLVIAAKKSDVLLVVLMGYLVFGEKNIKQRIIGSLVMIVGVLLIVFS